MKGGDGFGGGKLTIFQSLSGFRRQVRHLWIWFERLESKKPFIVDNTVHKPDRFLRNRFAITRRFTQTNRKEFSLEVVHGTYCRYTQISGS